MASRPERIFISVDRRSGRSALSFEPREASGPIVHEGDASGEQALGDARAIAASYPGCIIAGPYFHVSSLRPTRMPRRLRPTR